MIDTVASADIRTKLISAGYCIPYNLILGWTVPDRKQVMDWLSLSAADRTKEAMPDALRQAVRTMQ